jgi:hypothetical protein
MTEKDEEIARLRRENRGLLAEREILKRWRFSSRTGDEAS